MKKYIFRMLGFVAVLFIVLQIPNFFLPYHWSINHLDAKVKYLDKENDKPDTYFFGSSLTFSQIQPILFDSITQNTHSFNMGINGMRPPESFYVLRHFLENLEIDDTKYIILELLDVKGLEGDNQSSIRSKGTMDWNRLMFEYSYYYEEKEWDNIWQSTQTYLSYLFKYQMINPIKNYFIKNNSIPKKHRKIIQNNMGYMPMIERIGFRKGLAHYIVNQTLDETLILENLKKNTYRHYENMDDKANAILIKKINDFNRICIEKDIQLILLIPSRLNKMVLPTIKELEDIPNINLSHPNIYPEFYDLSNCYNPGHLNEKGSILYTNALATQFLEIKNNKK